MSTRAQQVLDQALQLGVTDRAELVEEILSSFESPDRAAVDARWAEEAEARIDAYERGELEAVPASKVFERIERRRKG